ncbi:MAG: Ribonuclease J [Firmicutes bacterium]|nr:Ribonuclease J [candidate division NPL-UPA2 bacterium]
MQETATYLKFWAGLTSIGGTVISVEHGKYRLMFDFGFSYNPNNIFGDKQVRLRPAHLVHDYLLLDMIPAVPGVYRQRDLGDGASLLSAEESPWQTMVLISHLHLDHMGAMGLVSPSVPVFLTAESLGLYSALCAIGEGVDGERDYSACRFDAPLAHGPFVITPLRVDHDVPGACSFHIRTPHGNLLYTGDFRLYGTTPPVAPQWLEAARTLGVDVLVSEGTTLRAPAEGESEWITGDGSLPDNLTTEDMLPGKLHALLSNTGLAVFNIYHRNLRRLGIILDAGRAAGRTVVLERETAYLARTLLAREDFAETSDICASLIKGNPTQYLVQNSYRNCLALLDFAGVGGSYIHSNGTPLGDFDPAYAKLRALVEKCGLEFHYVGATGHAIPQHLQYVADTVAPKVLVPLHSFWPQRLSAAVGQRVLPERGLVYRFKDGALEALPQV